MSAPSWSPGRARVSAPDRTSASSAAVEHDVGEHLEATYHPNVRAIRALEKPVIAAVNGAAAGAGLWLACVCDYRIAADASAFVPGFVGIGLVPDSGGIVLPRPAARALTGIRVDVARTGN